MKHILFSAIIFFTQASPSITGSSGKWFNENQVKSNVNNSQTKTTRDNKSQLQAAKDIVSQAQAQQNESSGISQLASATAATALAIYIASYGSCSYCIEVMIAAGITQMILSQMNNNSNGRVDAANLMIKNLTGYNGSGVSKLSITPPPLLLKSLGKVGISFDKNGNMKLPNGGIITPKQAMTGDFRTSKLSDTQVSLVKAKLADINNSAKAQNIAGNSDKNNGEGSTDENADANLKNKKSDLILASNSSTSGKSKNQISTRTPSSVFGLSKKAGNDNIGVSGDDIFLMMNRRYDEVRSRNGFMNNTNN